MPTSLPGLAAAIAAPSQAWPCRSQSRDLLVQPLVPAYHIASRGHPADRVRRLADAVAVIAERLDRLPDAYRYWQRFEPGAFFDLRPDQVAAMVRIERLGATVDVTLHADLLSPAFRGAERFWAQRFCPAYYAAAGGREDAYGFHFQKEIVPAMRRRLEAARVELAAAGNLLFRRASMVFLIAAAAPDERSRHLEQLPPGDEDLEELFRRLPSLTLGRSFDLLAH